MFFFLYFFLPSSFFPFFHPIFFYYFFLPSCFFISLFFFFYFRPSFLPVFFLCFFLCVYVFIYFPFPFLFFILQVCPSSLPSPLPTVALSFFFSLFISPFLYLCLISAIFFLFKKNNFFFNSLSSLPPSFISTDKQYNVQWIVCTASKSYLNSKHLVQTFYFLESNSDSHHHLSVHSGNLPIINTLLEKSTGSSQCLLQHWDEPVAIWWRLCATSVWAQMSYPTSFHKHHLLVSGRFLRTYTRTHLFIFLKICHHCTL